MAFVTNKTKATKPETKQYDNPAYFLDPKQGKYGTYYEGMLPDGRKVLFSQTKEGSKWKLTCGEEFSVGTVKDGQYGKYIPVVLDGRWHYATSKQGNNGPYVLLKDTGRAVEPREVSVASDDGAYESGRQDVTDIHSLDGVSTEGETEIPPQAFAPAKKVAAPAPKKTISAPPKQQPKKTAPKPSLDDLPF